MKMKLSDDDLRPLSRDELAKLTRGEAIALLEAEQRMRASIITEIASLRDHVVEVHSKYRSIIAKVFGKSSEKSKRNTGRTSGGETGGNSAAAKKVKLPSERYPNAEIITKTIETIPPPACPCCQKEMATSGMFEVSEALTKIPAKFVIERTQRHKYRCTGCHSSIVTATAPPRIILGSSYADALIIDVTLSKHLDLTPMERYVEVAARHGFPGLPPHSLIGHTIKLSSFLLTLYQMIRKTVLGAPVMFADETPHRMLEGDARSNWYLWLFMCRTAAFYEMHGTRSGDVASEVLGQSSCVALLTDVYAGYKKAVREANELRRSTGLMDIIMAYCNAHARRGFVGATSEAPKEAAWMVEKYKDIYRLNALAKEQSEATVLELRSEMKPHFEAMLEFAGNQADFFSSKSATYKAFNYFTNNYDGLTVFLTNSQIPIDNNSAERGLRSHVVGRKTWYGTHSKESAQAAAIHMTIIETCKLNGVNPREYYPYAVEEIHAGRTPLLPWEYKAKKDQESKNSS